jgi:small conductance mechanosensitive channel
MEQITQVDQITDKITNFDWTNFSIDAGLFIIKIIIIYVVYKIIRAIGMKLIHGSFERYQRKNSVSAGRSKTLQNLVDSIFSYVLIFFLVITLLKQIGIDTTGIIAGAGIVGLAVGFGAQGLVSDIVTGFFLLLERQVDVDDYVTIGSFSGVVEQVGLRTTQIRSTDGTLIYLPNRQITTLSNHTRGTMQALVDFTVGNQLSIDQAMTVIQRECVKMAEHEENIVEGPNVLGVQSIGSSEVVLRVIARTKNGTQAEIERKLRKIIKEAIDAELNKVESEN